MYFYLAPTWFQSPVFSDRIKPFLHIFVYYFSCNFYHFKLWHRPGNTFGVCDNDSKDPSDPILNCICMLSCCQHSSPRGSSKRFGFSLHCTDAENFSFFQSNLTTDHRSPNQQQNTGEQWMLYGCKSQLIAVYLWFKRLNKAHLCPYDILVTQTALPALTQKQKTHKNSCPVKRVFNFKKKFSFFHKVLLFEAANIYCCIDVWKNKLYPLQPDINILWQWQLSIVARNSFSYFYKAAQQTLT